MRAILLTACYCAALSIAGAARVHAHTKSETHAEWRVAGKIVHLALSVPLIEAKRLATPGEEFASDNRLLDYVRAHVTVTSKDQSCPVTDALPLAASSQFRRVELDFTCPVSVDIQLHSSAFFELVPTHVMFAQIVDSKGQLIEQLFTTDHRTVALDGSESQLRDASFFDYVLLGIHHIATGPDHMSFLLGLVLISRRVRDLVYVVTGFTIGHSATLALAVTGIVRPHAEYIDALVALTIAIIGAENAVSVTGRSGLIAAGLAIPLVTMAAASSFGIGTLPPLILVGAALFCVCYLILSRELRDSARLRLLVTLIFGLIHGFGFAATLLEMQIPPHKLAELLFGFNFGVEIAQLILVLSATLLAGMLARNHLAPPRRLVTDVGAAALVGIGAFWFVGRSF
jgi:hypothetical protein